MRKDTPKSALETCFADLGASAKQQAAQREAVRSMPRISTLERYIARQEKAIEHLPLMVKFTRPEFYLARAAKDLIYLNYNRAACAAIGRNKFASDKKLMAGVLANKRIARGQQPLNSRILFSLNSQQCEFTHATRSFV